MPIIDFKTLHFPPRYGLADKIHTLDCTWSDIILAAVTVGRKNWEWVTRYGTLSEHEMVFRIKMILAFLEENPYGEIERTDNLITLDPSEKVAISYFLGLVGTKLIAEKVFNIPWLMHLDVYTNFATGSDRVFFEKWITDRNTRPDLIGLDVRRDWVVIEAKGRTNNMGYTSLLEAKDQTKNIKTINGQYPALRFANSTYFSRNIWNFSLVDPEEYHENAPDIDITLGQFFRDYYSTIYNFLQHDETEKIEYENNSFTVRELKGTNVKIGIESNFFNTIKESSHNEQMFENAVLNSQPIQPETRDLTEDKPTSFEKNKYVDDIKIEDETDIDINSNKPSNIKISSSVSVGSDGIIVIY
ncbi:lipoprotein [Oceanobacillus picturae]|uniref:Lipoprotein, partial n=1 Tax=Oceanobacillus picturae TaxID=171693 RepID=A0A0U9H5E8_9BACI|nr:hypothetical protein [Oceanobacillus picturae]GAQ17859.1 lipoprotein [Oceanobacillus picturae]